MISQSGTFRDKGKPTLSKEILRRGVQRAAMSVAMDMLEARRMLSATHHHYHTWHHQRALPLTAVTGTTVEEKVRAEVAGVGVRAGSMAATFDSSAGPTGKTPAQIRQAYGLNQLSFGSVAADGSGETIAIIDAYNTPTIVNDLHQFDVAFGLPDPPSFQVLYQDGANNPPATDDSQGGGQNSWEVETSLDVEWAHVMAPEANIVLYEADDDNVDNLIGPDITEGLGDNYGGIYTLSHMANVSAISMSWDAPDTQEDLSYDPYFTTLEGHAGITFFGSTGDSGSAAGYPSVSPSVVAVGGTSLFLDGSNNYSSESAWSGSAGGVSTWETQPSYQTGVVTQSTTQRTTPDVAMDGDPNTGVPIYDSWDFGTSSPWLQVGGTSLSSPLWTGVMALVNQDRALNGLAPLDGPTQTLPDLYKLPASDFHDISSGGNHQNSATAGYDLVTGLGTPIIQNLVPGLAGITQPTAISLGASSANNAVVLIKDADGIHDDVTLNNTLVQQFVLADATTVNFTGGSGNDTFTLNFANGNPLPAGNATESANNITVRGISIDGQGGANTLQVIGTSGNDSVVLGNSTVSLGGGIATAISPSVANIQTISLPGGGGGSDSIEVNGGTWNINADTPSGTPNVSMTVDPGGVANLLTTQHLSNLLVSGQVNDAAGMQLAVSNLLLVNGGGAVVLAPSAQNGQVTDNFGTLLISGGGRLDLGNATLLLQNVSNEYVIAGYLANGYANGFWNGTTALNNPSGGSIESSTAFGDNSGHTTIGYGNSADFTFAGSTSPYAVGGAKALSGNQLVVRLAAPGDLLLTGTVTPADLALMLGAFGTSKYDSNPADLNTWARGNVDYNAAGGAGLVGPNDLALLLANFGVSM